MTTPKPAGLPARIAPAPGPPSPGGLELSKELQTVADTQLSNTRKAAENWRTGLAGLLTLLTTLTLVKGKESIDDLDVVAGYFLVALLALALLTGAVGLWFSLSAAYGKPRRTTRREIAAAGGLSGWRFQQAEEAGGQLRVGQFLAYLTLALATVAVGTTFYGAERPAPTVAQVITKQGQLICGTLSPAAAGQVKLKVNDATQIFLLNELSQFRVVESCP